MKDPLEDAGVDVDRGIATKLLVLVVLGLVGLVVFVPGTRTPLLIITGIILLVMLHEFGHFLTAKRAGMKATEFFLGFGPRLWSFRKGETEYGVKAIPAGGYVRIIGMTSMEDVPPEDEPRTFRKGTTANRLVVILAGVTVNLIIAWLLFFVAAVGQGEVVGPGTSVYAVSNGTAAAAAGLRAGDRIAAIDGTTIRSWNQLKRQIEAHGGIETAFTIERDGRLIEKQITPGVRDGAGFLGVSPSTEFRSLSVLEAVPKSFETFGDVTSASVQGIGRLFSPSGVTQYTKNFTSDAPKAGSTADIERPRSLVGIVDQGTQLFDGDIWGIIRLIGAISLILALFNLLPVLPFDGGHAAVVVYEGIASKVKGRRVMVDYRKLIPVSAVVVIFLVMISLSTMFLDIRELGR